jgi:hypothetical protein
MRVKINNKKSVDNIPVPKPPDATDKRLEMVIMLEGNYCVIPCMLSEMKYLSNLVITCIKEGSKDSLHYLNYKGYMVLSNKILGCYFREPPPSYQDKAIKLLEKISTPEGDDWKSGSE